MLWRQDRTSNWSSLRVCLQDDDVDGYELLQGLAKAAIDSCKVLASDYPNRTIPVTAPSSDQVLLLQRLVQIVVTSRNHSQSNADEEFLGLQRMVVGLGEIDFRKFRREKSPRGWWSCAWGSVVKERKGNASVKCVELWKGEEMEACSRVSTPSSTQLRF